jgi:hypothetical protein
MRSLEDKLRSNERARITDGRAEPLREVQMGLGPAAFWLAARG